jgi:phosphate/sulfate permease
VVWLIDLVLLLGGFIPTFEVPFWVVLSCAIAMTLGVLSGGWRIVRTLGFAIYRVRPVHALGSQLTSALVIFSASAFGAPVSTTHVVATSIMGIGASERPRAVRWAKARDIATTWVITIPVSALMMSAQGTTVVVRNAEGMAEFRPVVPGRRMAGRIEIVEGLSAGEVVVVEGS